MLVYSTLRTRVHALRRRESKKTYLFWGLTALVAEFSTKTLPDRQKGSFRALLTCSTRRALALQQAVWGISRLVLLSTSGDDSGLFSSYSNNKVTAVTHISESYRNWSNFLAKVPYFFIRLCRRRAAPAPHAHPLPITGSPEDGSSSQVMACMSLCRTAPLARSGALLSAPLPRGLRGEEQNSVQSEKAIVPAATGLYRFACAGRDVVY